MVGTEKIVRLTTDDEKVEWAASAATQGWDTDRR